MSVYLRMFVVGLLFYIEHHPCYFKPHLHTHVYTQTHTHEHIHTHCSNFTLPSHTSSSSPICTESILISESSWSRRAFACFRNFHEQIRSSGTLSNSFLVRRHPSTHSNRRHTLENRTKHTHTHTSVCACERAAIRRSRNRVCPVR